MKLLQRGETRRMLAERLAQADHGHGGVVLFLGLPGMGKTSLIKEFQVDAERSGAIVLRAVASSTERQIPMAVVGQLFDQVGPSAWPGEPAEPYRIDSLPAPRVDTLYRHVRELVDRAPVVLTVDDVQETDPLSLQCLLYVARRAGSSRVLVVLGERVEAPQSVSTLAAEFVRDSPEKLVYLAPLASDRAESAFDLRVTEAAGGSPLLLCALLADNAATDGGVRAGIAFRLAVKYLLGQLTGHLRAAAYGAAVLADDATPERLDALLGLPRGGAARAVATLDAIGLTEHGRYRLVAGRTAVLDCIDAVGRAELHRGAARLLYEDGAAATVVARHLVAGDVAEPGWTVRTLRNAAQEAMAHNDPEWAVTCLRTARRLGADERELAAVRAELAAADWELAPDVVRRQLDVLLADHWHGRSSPTHSTTLIGYLLWYGRPVDAAEVLADLETRSDDLCGRSRAALTVVRSWFDHTYIGRLVDGQPPQHTVGVVDAQSAGASILRALRSTRSMTGILERAECLLQSVGQTDPPMAPVVAALVSLADGAWLDRAAEWCDRLAAGAHRPTPKARAILAAGTAVIAGMRGDFDVAGQRADEALSLLPPTAWGIAIGMPLAAKIFAAVARGDHDTAVECLRIPVPDSMYQTLPGLHYLLARGRCHAMLANYCAARDDFRACLEIMSSSDVDLFRTVPWRTHAAEALVGSDWSADAIDDGSVERLSKAEREVAVLASAGRTNREIATRLSVTVSTVEQHLTNVYRKLGIRRRTELPGALDHRSTGPVQTAGRRRVG